MINLNPVIVKVVDNLYSQASRCDLLKIKNSEVEVVQFETSATHLVKRSVLIHNRNSHVRLCTIHDEKPVMNMYYTRSSSLFDLVNKRDYEGLQKHPLYKPGHEYIAIVPDSTLAYDLKEMKNAPSL